MKISVDLSETRPKTCRKCGKDKPLFRHHMGNDAFLGIYNRRIKRDYYKYLDCVYLCNRCHMIVHYVYDPLVQKWSDFTEHGAWSLRLVLIDRCRTWLATNEPNPHVPKAFRVRWQKSYQAWRQANPRRRKKVDG